MSALRSARQHHADQGGSEAVGLWPDKSRFSS